MKVIAAAIIASTLAISSQATTVYDNGAVNDIVSDLGSDAASPAIQITNGTTVNWNAGASILGGGGTGTTGQILDLRDSSTFNLNGGTVVGARTGSTHFRAFLFGQTAGYSGVTTLNSGTISITNTTTSTTVRDTHLFEGAGGAVVAGTAIVNGGTYSIAASGPGARSVDVLTLGSGLTQMHYEFNGGTFNVVKQEVGSTTGTARVIVSGATPATTVVINGGTFNLASPHAANELFSMNGTASLDIWGGQFNSTDLAANAIPLNGVIAGTAIVTLHVTEQTMIDNGWGTSFTFTSSVADLPSATLDNGQTLDLAAITITGGSLVVMVPEPASLTLFGLAGVGLLLMRRKARI